MGSKQKSPSLDMNVPIIMEAMDQETTSKVVEEATVRGLNSLDVGCGFTPEGDVNCDLYVTDVDDHRRGGDTNKIITAKIPNFVRCDAQYLPFRKNLFNAVVCKQVIEHVDRPSLLFSELVRVSRNMADITVETTHRLGEALSLKRTDRKWYRIHHISKMTRSYLRRMAAQYGCKHILTYIVNYAHFPHDYLPWLKLPFEIGVRCVVQKT